MVLKHQRLDEVKEKFRLEFASLTRALAEQTKEQMRKKANYILAQATTRFAGEYATEKLTSLIQIENDEVKGRIIGKEGRNIKTLEMVTGVDIIIDETPNTILVSSFNLYRRAIAVRTIELLIEDGRIQPARIEEIFQKVCDEFEEAVYRDGEEATYTAYPPDFVRWEKASGKTISQFSGMWDILFITHSHKEPLWLI